MVKIKKKKRKTPIQLIRMDIFESTNGWKNE